MSALAANSKKLLIAIWITSDTIIGMKKYLPTIIIVALVAIVLGFVIFALAKPDSSNQTQKLTVAADPAKLSEGPFQGPADAKVVFTEFGDYQCPACGKYFPILRDQILPQFNGQIKFVFLNYPLTSIHKNAQAGAQAAEAARLQNKFWEMHDKLYENQSEWTELDDPTPKFQQFAKDLGLNVDQFKKDYNSQQVKDIIAQNVALGDAFKIQGTPSFFVNGKPVNTDNGAEGIIQAIKAALGQ